MYRAFYGMTKNPFSKEVPAEEVFESEDHREFKSRMEYFRTVKGFAVAYGEPGTGKTTSVRAYVQTLNPQLYKVVYLPLSTLTVTEFYRNLSIGLGLIPRYRKVDMFHDIQQYVISAKHQKNLTPFLILDEAHLLANEALNDLRLLLNFQMDSKEYAMALLLGHPILMLKLSIHVNEAIRQRIMVTHQFRGLSKDEVPEYIEKLLRSAGVSEPIFTPEAVSALAAISGGSPRLLNSLAEKCLILGYQKKLRSLGAEVVEQARKDVPALSS